MFPPIVPIPDELRHFSPGGHQLCFGSIVLASTEEMMRVYYYLRALPSWQNATGLQKKAVETIYQLFLTCLERKMDSQQCSQVKYLSYIEKEEKWIKKHSEKIAAIFASLFTHVEELKRNPEDFLTFQQLTRKGETSNFQSFIPRTLTFQLKDYSSLTFSCNEWLVLDCVALAHKQEVQRLLASASCKIFVEDGLVLQDLQNYFETGTLRDIDRTPQHWAELLSLADRFYLSSFIALVIENSERGGFSRFASMMNSPSFWTFLPLLTSIQDPSLSAAIKGKISEKQIGLQVKGDCLTLEDRIQRQANQAKIALSALLPMCGAHALKEVRLKQASLEFLSSFESCPVAASIDKICLEDCHSLEAHFLKRIFPHLRVLSLDARSIDSFPWSEFHAVPLEIVFLTNLSAEEFLRGNSALFKELPSLSIKSIVCESQAPSISSGQERPLVGKTHLFHLHALSQELSLSSSFEVTDFWITLLAKKLPLLQKAYLPNCTALTSQGLSALSDSCENLHVLELTRCPLVSQEAIQRFRHLSRLNLCETLDLVQLDLAHFPQLRELDIAESSITALLNANTPLVSLSLSHCPELFFPNGMDTSALTSLTIRNCPAFIRHHWNSIKQSAHTVLTKLILEDLHLLDLFGFKNLKTLLLRNVFVENFPQMGKAAFTDSLTDLSLECVSIRDRDLLYLVLGCTNLTNLHLANDPIISKSLQDTLKLYCPLINIIIENSEVVPPPSKKTKTGIPNVNY